MEWMFVLVIVLLVPIVYFVAQIESAKNKAYNKAVSEFTRKKLNYQAALEALREDPTNPSRHEQALTLGRIYSAATRNNERVTLFDETALANDIRAVTANATQTKTTSVVYVAPAQSIDERISALKKMRENDLLTDEEFEQKRKDILNSI